MQVCIDGCDIATMDRHFLREQIGLVSQEPVLFSCRSVLQQRLHSLLTALLTMTGTQKDATSVSTEPEATCC